MTAVAINQPCYLPWRGQFAPMKAADVFVFYDDVQFTTTPRFFHLEHDAFEAAGVAGRQMVARQAPAPDGV